MAGAMVNKIFNLFGMDTEPEDEDYENEAYDEEEIEDNETEERKLFGRKNKVVNMPQTQQIKMVISQPTTFEQSEEICNYLNIDSNALNTSSNPSGTYMPSEESSGGGGGDTPKTESREETKISTGNNVTITDGEYKDMDGEITDIDEENNKVTLKVNIDGQEKTVEVSMNQISSSKSEV